MSEFTTILLSHSLGVSLASSVRPITQVSGGSKSCCRAIASSELLYYIAELAILLLVQRSHHCGCGSIRRYRFLILCQSTFVLIRSGYPFRHITPSWLLGWMVPHHERSTTYTNAVDTIRLHRYTIVGWTICRLFTNRLIKNGLIIDCVRGRIRSWSCTDICRLCWDIYITYRYPLINALVNCQFIDG